MQPKKAHPEGVEHEKIVTSSVTCHAWAKEGLFGARHRANCLHELGFLRAEIKTTDRLAIAKQALTFIGTYRTPPTPHIYELWFRYVEGEDRALHQELSSLLERQSLDMTGLHHWMASKKSTTPLATNRLTKSCDVQRMRCSAWPASVGVAILRFDDTRNSWFERADKLLYAAKKSGKNCVMCEREIR